MADLHLGYQQYNLEARFRDFRKAFSNAIDVALDEQVDAVVIAGDFFHKTTVDPSTLFRAEQGLQLLKDANVPVLAVHGNHDGVRYRDRVSWLEYLGQRELLTVLEPDLDSDPPTLEAGRGYVDLDGVRFIGLPWYGASTAIALQKLAAACAALPTEGIHFSALIMHAGLAGVVPDMHDTLRLEDLDPMRPYAQYVGLGHIHQNYDREDWVYNPGSLEACSFSEARPEYRGVYVVDVAADGTHVARRIITPARPFHSLDLHTDHCPTPEALCDAVRRAAQEFAGLPAPADDDSLPVVRLVLRGNLTFDRAYINLETLRKIVEEELDTLLVRVDNRSNPLGFDFAVDDEDISREALERGVFEDLARGDSRYGPYAAVWGGLLAEVKHHALEDAPPEAIFTLLDSHMTRLEQHQLAETQGDSA